MAASRKVRFGEEAVGPLIMARLPHLGLIRLVGSSGGCPLVKHLALQPRYIVLALIGAIFGVVAVRLVGVFGVRQLLNILVCLVWSRNAPLILNRMLFRGVLVDRTVEPISRLVLLPRMTSIPRLASLENPLSMLPDIVNELRASIIILLGGAVRGRLADVLYVVSMMMRGRTRRHPMAFLSVPFRLGLAGWLCVLAISLVWSF